MSTAGKAHENRRAHRKLQQNTWIRKNDTQVPAEAPVTEDQKVRPLFFTFPASYPRITILLLIFTIHSFLFLIFSVFVQKKRAAFINLT